MKPEFIIALTSIVIAGAALFVTIWQGFVTRRHNRLMVRPVFRIDRDELNDQPIRIILHNVGVGPGFIDRFDVMVDGANIVGDRVTRMNTAMDRIGLREYRIQYFSPSIGEAINVGESQALIKITVSVNNTPIFNTMIAVLPRLTFSIAYKSIYGETYYVNG